MSTYEWERGTIKLPRAAVSEVRTAIVDAANRAQQNLFDRATALLPKLLAAGKGKRGFDFAAAFHTMMTHSADSDGEDYHELQALLFPVKRRPLPRTGWGNHWEEIRPKKPTKPRKSSLKTISKRGDIGIALGGEASVTLKKDGTLTWDVSENNHACDRARAHPIARALFGALHRVTWTRGSGGSIVGNNEYSRDSSEEGGGANYVVESFGPEQKQQRFARFARFR